MTEPDRSGYIPVSGTEIYYEEHGTGDPVLLIHGALASAVAFRQLVPRLAHGRRLILVDLQGHGRTRDRGGPLLYERLADDCADVLRELAPEGASVVGFSMGGGTALQLAFRHPELVKRLVVLSAPFRNTGWYPETLALFRDIGAHRADEYRNSGLFDDHLALMPRPDEYPALLDKLGELLGRFEYDWGEALETISVPTLVALGDVDTLSPRHAVEFFERLGGGFGMAVGGERPQPRLAILPGVAHSEMPQSPLVADCLVDFLR